MSYYEISEENTRELQRISLEMLLYFDRFCESHHLTYFLCGGCCIGAIRNQGFIPWDDDVDIFMKRCDYERLKELWADTERYEIEYTSPEYECFSPAVTICDRTTTFIKTYRKDMNVSHGVAMDIFPLDGCPEGIHRVWQKLCAMLFSLFTVEKAPENHGALIKAAGRLGLFLVPGWKGKTRVWQFFERQMSKYRIENCDRITELCAGPYYMQKEYPKDAFREAVRTDFEGCRLPVPVGYDTYLTEAFGDYMRLPPEEDRKAHHEYEFIDLETSYRQYFGTKYCVGSAGSMDRQEAKQEEEG